MSCVGVAMTARNAVCPCGSGKKYKHCCGLLTAGSGAGEAAIKIQSSSADQSPGSARGPRAAASLGLRHLTADGVPADPALGVALIEKAAQAGDAEAAFVAATLASSTLWREQNWSTAFNYLLQAAQSGHSAAQDALQILAGGPLGEAAHGKDWAAMREQIDIASWLEIPAPKLVSDTPQIQVIEHFVPVSLCRWLITQAHARLARATIYDDVTGGAIRDGRRTNSQCDLDVEISGVLTFILRARIGAATGRPDRAMEVPKVLHYNPGETFAEHYDYLDETVPAFKSELSRRGQRTKTFLVYLNDDYTGGETVFPKIDYRYKGRSGDALLFANVDERGVPDDNTRHAGLPPESGEKWLFSQWIRGLPAT